MQAKGKSLNGRPAKAQEDDACKKKRRRMLQGMEWNGLRTGLFIIFSVVCSYYYYFAYLWCICAFGILLMSPHAGHLGAFCGNEDGRTRGVERLHALYYDTIQLRSSGDVQVGSELRLDYVIVVH